MFRLIAFLFMLSFSWLFSAEDGDSSASGEGGGEGSGEGSEGAAPELKHSDADVDKYKGDARREARQAAINELLGKAEGAASIDDLVAAWEEKRTVEEATKSDLAKLEEERDKYKTQAEAAAALANDRLVGAELRTALAAAGVPSDRLADALALVDKSSLEVDDKGTVTGLEGAVKGLLEPRPWLKEEVQQQQRRAVDTSKGGPVDPDVAPGLDRLRAAYG